GSASRPLQDKKASEKNRLPDEEAIYVRNAGMIILHPFLPELFTRTGLLIDRQWKDVSSPHTAIAILEYLVSGKEEFSDPDFPLNKIICGMAIDEVWQPIGKLAEETLSECEDLLHDVIVHWAVLKNTSVEGLRETFLQRNGKLMQVENGWSLH